MVKLLSTIEIYAGKTPFIVAAFLFFFKTQSLQASYHQDCPFTPSSPLLKTFKRGNLQVNQAKEKIIFFQPTEREKNNEAILTWDQMFSNERPPEYSTKSADTQKNPACKNPEVISWATLLSQKNDKSSLIPKASENEKKGVFIKF